MNEDALSFLRRQYAELGPFQTEFRVRSESDWPVTLDHCFGSPAWRETGHRFDLVGIEGTGGLFCLWHYPELGSISAPVVFLGSDGEGISVVANDAASFVEVLAQGYWWFGAIGSYTRDEENLLQPAFAEFAAHAEAFFGRLLRPPESVLEAALTQHPNFAAFVAGVIEPIEQSSED